MELAEIITAVTALGVVAGGVITATARRRTSKDNQFREVADRMEALRGTLYRLHAAYDALFIYVRKLRRQAMDAGVEDIPPIPPEAYDRD